MKVSVQYTLPFLEKLAHGLKDLYRRIMEKAFEGEEKRNTAYSMLSIVAVSRKPLTIYELCMACSLHDRETKDRRIAFTREDVKLCRLMIVETMELSTLSTGQGRTSSSNLILPSFRPWKSLMLN